MKHDLPSNSPVVIYVNDPSQTQGIRSVGGHPISSVTGQVSEQKAAFDPVEVHREFPARWQAYIRANYRNYHHVMMTFNVSERTARKWWDGETGCVGGYVSVAVRTHPEVAPQMLFAAE